jgi:3-amino-5-hydroxybenzoate synthase
MAQKSGLKLEFPAWPQYGEEERTGLMRALEQGQWWRMTGAEVDAFEDEFSEYHGTSHGLAVTNGTHALELALQVLGVKPGTEVIVPAFTFISSSQAAQRLGAVAVPVDIDAGTLNIDPAAVAGAITSRTAAIMPVHMGGQMCNMDELGKLSADSGVPLIQDAAHAHGAEWAGKKVGEFSTVAAFSFQNGKLMTAGEGGFVTFVDADQREEAFLRHSCGRPKTDRYYYHKTSGSNFRLNEFSASVLRAQLARLPEQIDTRERNWPLLAGLLTEIDGVQPQITDARATRNPHYMAMFRVPGLTAERRNALVDALIERGLPAFAAFRAIYRSDGFWENAAPDESLESIAARCPNTEAVYADTVWLHHRTLLGTEKQMHEIAEILSETLAMV